MDIAQVFEELENPNQRLRFFREKYDLSQKELGAHFGKGQTTYRNWEDDGARIPTHARTILHDLGMELAWLDTGEGDMLRPGVKLDVVVVDGRKQLRKTVSADVRVSTSPGGNIEASRVEEELAGYVATTPQILPSMVAQAAQMVDAVINAMPPENRPKDEKRWDAYATIAQFLAQDKAEGKEGRARTFLLGLKAEWAEAQVTNGS